MIDKKLTVSQFSNNVYEVEITDKTHIELTWGRLVELLSKPKAYKTKEDIPGFNGWQYKLGGSRCADDAIFTEILIVDVDDGCRVRDFIDKYKDLEFFLYTTASHSANLHKFRAIFLLESPLSPSQLQSRRKRLTKLFPMADEASWNPSQPMKMPSQSENFRCTHNKGKRFNIHDLKEDVQPKFTPAIIELSQDDESKFEELLKRVASEDDELEYSPMFKIVSATAAFYKAVGKVDKGKTLVVEALSDRRALRTKGRRGHKASHKEIESIYMSQLKKTYQGNPIGFMVNYCKNMD